MVMTSNEDQFRHTSISLFPCEILSREKWEDGKV